MNVKVSMIHPSTPPRISAFIDTIKRYGHNMVNDYDADIWFVDCIWPDDISQEIVNRLLDFKGKVVLMSLGDWNIFRTDSLPEELIKRVDGFIKIQWSNDNSIYDQIIKDKAVTIYPYLIGGLPQPTDKNDTVCFFGLPTGHQKSDNNLRIRACRLLKNEDWFVGGIVGQENNSIHRDISGIEIGHRPRSMYLRAINRSLLSLCMPGNSPLTYRLFETIGIGSAAISCNLDSVSWLNKLEANTHYISVENDLSNLLEVCECSLRNKAKTLEIAENGYKIHKSYYEIQPDGGLTENMWRDIQSQFKACGVDL